MRHRGLCGKSKLRKKRTGKLLEEKFKGRIPLEEKQSSSLWALIEGDESGIERTDQVFTGVYVA